MTRSSPKFPLKQSQKWDASAKADVEAFAVAFARLLAGDTAMLQCTRCGKSGSCGCWVRCSCGWSAEAGKPCNNPETTRCSTKVQFGVYNRRTRRYEVKDGD